MQVEAGWSKKLHEVPIQVQQVNTCSEMMSNMVEWRVEACQWPGSSICNGIKCETQAVLRGLWEGVVVERVHLNEVP